MCEAQSVCSHWRFVGGGGSALDERWDVRQRDGMRLPSSGQVIHVMQKCIAWAEAWRCTSTWNIH